ncbi:MAG: flagellin [Methanomicrobiales archaeon]|jgi:archaellin|nr:flagellin [Methanomicrobiales archaeon]
MKRDDAFNDLESAIMLIALVVIAAVFSYVMLGAVFFATQGYQEAPYATALQQAISQIVLDDDIVYEDKGSTGHIGHLTLTLMAQEGEDPQKLSELLFLFSSQDTPIPYVIEFDNAFDGRAVPVDFRTVVVGKFGVHGARGELDGNMVMRAGEKKTVYIRLHDDGTTAPAGPATDGWLQIEIKQKVGGPTTIHKRVAAGFAHG